MGIKSNMILSKEELDSNKVLVENANVETANFAKTVLLMCGQMSIIQVEEI